MPITNDDLVRTTQVAGNRGHLRDLLEERRPPDVAFFESETSRIVYYAVSPAGAWLSPVAKLFLSGVYVKLEIGRVYRNYSPRTGTDRGVVALCGGLFYKDDGQRTAGELVDMLDGSMRRRRFVQVKSSGLPALLRGNFPLYAAAAPNVDVTRENTSTPGNHDGFHTVHRLYMAAAFRLLRAKQNAGGREGVAALLVDGATGRILAWGLKNPAHPVLHAETSAIIAYGGQLPANARLYSTLKPCKMCAGLICTISGGGHRVFHGQHDPADAAQDTDIDNDNSGRLLNGARSLPGVRGIVPIYADGQAANVTLAEMLDSKHKLIGGSVIDFATSDEARTIYHRSDRMFERKIAKYADNQRGDRNTNVWAVLSYLTGFLNHIGVGTTALNGPA